MTSYPRLHPDVTLTEGVDVGELWERFQFFEALHHHLDIMNPLSADQLDRVVEAISPSDGLRVMDIGCGHGELLIRLANRAQIQGLGIDLSPWQANRAAHRAVEYGVDELLWFWLGDGVETPVDNPWDVVVLLGVSWIWGGFDGTLDALLDRTVPGGLIVFGDTYLKDPLMRPAAEAAYGPTLTHAEELGRLRAAGVDVLQEIQTGPGDWLRYDADRAAGARQWIDAHPADQRFADRHEAWSVEHADDHTWLGWTVWIGRTPAGDSG